MPPNDVIVVGGGLVGAAIAYGLARDGVKVTMLDEGDVAFRASRGNFGLVWAQSKGLGMPRYATWTREGVGIWPRLAQSLLEETGVDVALQQPGGFWLGLSEAEVVERVDFLRRLQDESGDFPCEMLDHAELKARIPAIGPEVVGGSYCPLDGHANPLKLLRALHTGAKKHGARIVTGVTIERVDYSSGVHTVRSSNQSWQAPKIVLAAGLGNRKLAEQVDLNAPVEPNRGQVLITERIRRFLDYPTNKARQTDEGSVQLGTDVREYAGLNDLTDIENMRALAQRAVRTFPLLATVKLVRAWGALRVMPPDGFPIYEESITCPGAFVATCHSGVTLAAAHAFRIARWIAGGDAPEGIEVFTGNRFLKQAQAQTHGH